MSTWYMRQSTIVCPTRSYIYCFAAGRDTFKMVKFNVLQNNRVFMTWLGIYSNRLTDPANEFFKSISTYLILAAMANTVILSVMQIYDPSSDFTSKLDAILGAFGMSQAIGVFLNARLKMKMVKELHIKLQSLVDEGLCSFLTYREYFS